MATILVIDDEEPNRLALERILLREGWEVSTAPNGRAGLDRLGPDVGVVITDLKMPGLDGMEFLKTCRLRAADVQVIVATAYGTVEIAVEAMREGAYDFVTKPLRRQEVVASVRKALDKFELLRENRRLREQLGDAPAREMIGQSAAMRSLLDEAAQVAPSLASVLIAGESGTGKGQLARWLHRNSGRKQSRLVTVNCAAIPENLLESELFGHEAGAFTGAVARKEGRFDLAHGGTLFLDEITELPVSLQAKLLRVLQDGEYERVGGTRTLTADVRLIAATNVEPEKAVADGRLRPDLYYRLNVIRLVAPPLRERVEDIALLARHFIGLHARRNGRSPKVLDADALGMLEHYRWPGNVRELENVMERAVVLSTRETIGTRDLPAAIRGGDQPESAGWLTFAVGTPLRDVERRMIEATLRTCDGDRALAASLLGITARTIYRREAEWRGDEPREPG